MQAAHALSPSGSYTVPAAPACRAELLDAIDALPAAAAPEAFGLHANADVSRDVRATEALLGSLVLMGAGGASRGAAPTNTNPCKDQVNCVVESSCVQTSGFLNKSAVSRRHCSI